MWWECGLNYLQTQSAGVSESRCTAASRAATAGSPAGTAQTWRSWWRCWRRVCCTPVSWKCTEGGINRRKPSGHQLLLVNQHVLQAGESTLWCVRAPSLVSLSELMFTFFFCISSLSSRIQFNLRAQEEARHKIYLLKIMWHLILWLLYILKGLLCLILLFVNLMAEVVCVFVLWTIRGYKLFIFDTTDL